MKIMEKKKQQEERRQKREEREKGNKGKEEPVKRRVINEIRCDDEVEIDLPNSQLNN